MVLLCYPSSIFLCSAFKVGHDQISEVAQMRYLGLLLGLTVLDCQRKSNIQNRLNIDNSSYVHDDQNWWKYHTYNYYMPLHSLTFVPSDKS
jgi:hypothetical protein